MIWIFGVTCLLLLPVVGITIFSWRFQARRARVHDLPAVVNNAREIHKALYEFDVEYGEFPRASTISRVQGDTSTTMPLGTATSNDYFRQLLAMGLGNEKMFYSGSRKFRKPDDLYSGAKALQKRECGFAYVIGLSISEDASTPLVISPVIRGAHRFDPEPLEGKAVVLRIDGSAIRYPIMKDGKIDMGGGVYLDPARPEWNGKPLTIAWPE